MFETIVIILLCVALLGGIGDIIFDIFGFGLKLVLCGILIIASIYLGIKLFVVMIPWMFALCCVGLLVGIIWLFRVIFK